eukprot:131208-Prymnesium_polylepis.1
MSENCCEVVSLSTPRSDAIHCCEKLSAAVPHPCSAATHASSSSDGHPANARTRSSWVRSARNQSALADRAPVFAGSRIQTSSGSTGPRLRAAITNIPRRTSSRTRLLTNVPKLSANMDALDTRPMLSA